MRRLLITLFIMLVVQVGAGAQQPDSSRVLLGLQGGGGIGLYRDLGASPLTYKGVELHPSVSVEIHRPEWRYESRVGIDGGAYGRRLRMASLYAYGGHVSLGFAASHSIHSQAGWQLWAGASVDNLFDIRYNPQFGNASVGIADFTRLGILLRGEYSLQRWLFFGQLWGYPLALMYRPGFAYISNYDRDISNPVANTFDQYGLYLAGMTGLTTQVGFRYRVAGGNEIGLAYEWHYLTSRWNDEVAPWLFQYASHGLIFNLLFKL